MDEGWENLNMRPLGPHPKRWEVFDNMVEYSPYFDSWWDDYVEPEEDYMAFIEELNREPIRINPPVVEVPLRHSRSAFVGEGPLIPLTLMPPSPLPAPRVLSPPVIREISFNPRRRRRRSLTRAIPMSSNVCMQTTATQRVTPRRSRGRGTNRRRGGIARLLDL